MATKHEFSPFGAARHPWITKPDTKYIADGLYHMDLILEGSDAATLKAQLAQASEAAFAAYMEDDSPRGGARLTPGERKKWSVYYPFEELEDDQGEPTGQVLVAFKQNAKIRLEEIDPATGTNKVEDVTIMLVDSDNNDLPPSTIVGNGSVVRVMYSTRATIPLASMYSTRATIPPFASFKQVGVRLDFAGVQVKELKGSGGGRPGFGKVEGGFVRSA